MGISLSQSKIKTWLRCPKKYEYRYIEDLQPKKKDLPMERGIWIHECLEAYYKGKSWKRVLKRLTVEFRGLFDEERLMYGDLPGEVERIMKSYINYWDDSEWEVLAVEKDFDIKLPSGIRVKGRMDGVIRDSMGVWVLEHKTNKVVPRDPPDIPDPQTTIYNYALKSMGLEGSGTIHNHVRTKPPSEPRVLVRGGLSKRCDTDRRTYLRAIKREGLDPADYEDVLNKLKHSEKKFFVRFRVPWKKTAVKHMLEDANSIASWIELTTHYPRHLSKMCKRDCPYHQVCVIELEGGDADRLKRLNFVKDKGPYG